MLTEHNAIITGATSGIGRGIALKLAADGVRVMINGFGDQSDIDTLLAELETLSGKKPIYSPADMSDPAQIKTMMQQAETEMGHVDIL